MANSIPGKLIKVKINGVEWRCQTDATLTMTVNMTENDPCKPTDAQVTSGQTTPYVTRSADSRDWTITFSAQAFADAVGASQIELSKLFINGALNVTAQFLSSTTQTTYPNGFLYEGTGILSSLTINAPEAGNATYDAEVTGNGPLTLTEIPITT